MKSTLGVLSLVLILVWTQAQDLTCNKTLSPEELHQVEGDWVLVWLVIDKTKIPENPLTGFSSSHVELRVRSNHSLSFHERNVYGDGKCAEFIMNLTMPHSNHRLHSEEIVVHRDGEVKHYNKSAAFDFLHASENTMSALYHSASNGTFLLSYRREGNHSDVEILKDLEENRRLAQCLNLSGDNYKEWSYDGKADFCHRKSAAEETDKEKEKEEEKKEES